jgi:FtsZ-binding cell division protein ZapB
MTFFQNLTEPQAIIVGFIITAIIGPIVVLLFTTILNRVFNIRIFKVDLNEKLQGMVEKSFNQTNTALDELAQEREARKSESKAWEEKYSALESRLQDIEHKQAGPYLLTSETEFNTLPVPTIIHQSHKLELMPRKVNA